MSVNFNVCRCTKQSTVVYAESETEDVKFLTTRTDVWEFKIHTIPVIRNAQIITFYNTPRLRLSDLNQFSDEPAKDAAP